MVVKRIEPVSCAKIVGVLYAVLGLVIGCIFSLASLAGGLASNTPRGAGLGAIIGIGAVVAFPILYGALGFVGSLIFAWLYNVIAQKVGGIEMDLQ